MDMARLQPNILVVEDDRETRTLIAKYLRNNSCNVTIASGVTLDYFFPELIEIGDNTIVGMDAMVLAHEFLHDRWRAGKVTIGRNVLVGAQSTVLAGVRVGDGATISAMSLVHKSVPAGAFVGGVPVTIIRT
jgi:acetyltransferase-like isoleucine patch superfamily enzyme